MDMRKKGLCDGSITVEMSIVFPFILIVFWAVVWLFIYIHDVTTASMLNEYENIKQTQVKLYNYDLYEKEIGIVSLVNEPFLPVTNEYKDANMIKLNEKINDYKQKIMSGKYDKPYMEYKPKRSGIKNATFIRIMHVMIDHAERITDD